MKRPVNSPRPSGIMGRGGTFWGMIPRVAVEAVTHRSLVAVVTNNYRNNETTVAMATERQAARILSGSVIKGTMKV